MVFLVIVMYVVKLIVEVCVRVCAIPNMKIWKKKNNKILFAYPPKRKLISIFHIKLEKKIFKKSKLNYLNRF